MRVDGHLLSRYMRSQGLYESAYWAGWGTCAVVVALLSSIIFTVAAYVPSSPSSPFQPRMNEFREGS